MLNSVIPVCPEYFFKKDSEQVGMTNKRSRKKNKKGGTKPAF
jgi:hypothetical protein